ncbi:MAG: sugar phosphate isomerase/epimerase family protein [Planctomycetota bacterium]
MPDLVGIDAGPAESIKLAARAGFSGLDLRIQRFADKIERLNEDSLLAAMEAASLQPGYCSLTAMKMEVSEPEWQSSIRQTPRFAQIAQELGYRRATSVVVPGSNDLSFQDNFARHVSRTREAADILADFGISFGLEYISPLTRRAPFQHQFVHDLASMLELLEAVDRPNTGLMLDSFHWACANETADDIAKLKTEQIVAVHVNDLIANVPLSDQVVNQRALPGETGLIDITSFLRALETIGYDGPITAEPTHPRWLSTDAFDAAKLTADAIKACFDQAGIPITHATQEKNHSESM